MPEGAGLLSLKSSWATILRSSSPKYTAQIKLPRGDAFAGYLGEVAQPEGVFLRPSLLTLKSSWATNSSCVQGQLWTWAAAVPAATPWVRLTTGESEQALSSCMFHNLAAHPTCRLPASLAEVLH